MIWDIPTYKESKAEREYLHEFQEGKCNQCDQSLGFRYLQVEHIIPVAHGGSHEMRNLQLLCQPCRNRESDKVV